jgi:hypothetical protein
MATIDMPSGATVEATAPEHWTIRELRKVAAAASAGLVVGFVVNGVGSRLAMLVLARLNPDTTGLISDDGFRIGQFTDATLGLLLFTTAVGVLGGVLYLAVRSLRIGPAWFQRTSIAVGSAVVVGAMLVHTDGIDFRVLDPVWLAIAMFVALPGLYALGVSLLADRWLADGSWFLTGSRWRLVTLTPLVLTAPAAPLVALLAVGYLAARTRPVRRMLDTGWPAQIARVALAVIFAVALGDLIRDTATLL